MRDLNTIIRDNEDAMKRHHLGLPLHYLHEKVGTHIELIAETRSVRELKPKRIDMDQLAQKYNEWCRKRFQG